jgi:hypothetical protein
MGEESIIAMLGKGHIKKVGRILPLEKMGTGGWGPCDDKKREFSNFGEKKTDVYKYAFPLRMAPFIYTPSHPH